MTTMVMIMSERLMMSMMMSMMMMSMSMMSMSMMMMYRMYDYRFEMCIVYGWKETNPIFYGFVSVRDRETSRGRGCKRDHGGRARDRMRQHRRHALRGS